MIRCKFRISKFICDLFDFKLIGKNIKLTVVETDKSGLTIGSIIKGNIYSISYENIITTGVDGNSTNNSGPCAIIQLDSLINYKGKEIKWIIALPRHNKCSFFQLKFHDISVYVHYTNDSNLPKELFWDDIIGIWVLKNSS